jgi:hypothetical protein
MKTATRGGPFPLIWIVRLGLSLLLGDVMTRRVF